MKTFLEEKLESLEAIVKARRRARLAAVAGIALFSTAAVTGNPALVGLGVVALVASGVLTWRSRRLSTTVAAEGDLEIPVEGEAKPAAPAADPHPPPEPAGAALAAPVECAPTLPAAVALRTEEGEIVLPAGRIRAAFRLSHRPERPEAEDELDYPRLECRVRDGDGRWWESSTYLHRDAFTRPLEAADREILFWENAPDGWRVALAERCLIAGLRQLMDSRERIELPVGAGAVTMMFKYQGPLLDLGWLDEAGEVVVRASRMYYEVWADGEYADAVDQVTFAYRMDPLELLPLTATADHWEEWEAWEEDPGYVRPGPLFRRFEP